MNCFWHWEFDGTLQESEYRFGWSSEKRERRCAEKAKAEHREGGTVASVLVPVVLIVPRRSRGRERVVC